MYRANNILNERTEIIRKCRHRNKYALTSYNSVDWNIRCKVEVSWDYWNFSSLWQLWSRLTEASSISINFKRRCISYDVYSAHIFTIMHVDPFHVSKGEFPVICDVTSFKIRNNYIVANMTVVVHLAEDCCGGSIKLWVKKLIDSLTNLLTFYNVWFIVWYSLYVI